MTKRRGRKRKAAPVTLAPVKTAAIPKLVRISTVTMDNPYFNPDPLHAEDRTNPARIEVALSMRESYITYLRGRRAISEEQYLAAVKVCTAFERLGGAGAGAMDFTRDVVDGGTTPVPAVEIHNHAREVLSDCHLTLGPAGHDLVLKMAGQGLWPKDMAPRDAKKRDYLSMRFRECLEHLAIRWGYQKARARAV